MKLKAKPGINGVGVGGQEYAVDKDGCVNVPDEFVPAVLKAGFVLLEGGEVAPVRDDSVDDDRT
jgi:hypothetical protein